MKINGSQSVMTVDYLVVAYESIEVWPKYIMERQMLTSLKSAMLPASHLINFRQPAKYKTKKNCKEIHKWAKSKYSEN